MCSGARARARRPPAAPPAALGGPLRQELLDRYLRNLVPGRRGHERPPALARALEDRDRRAAHAGTPSRAPATTRASRSICLRAALRDRDEQAVLVLGIVAAQPVARVDAPRPRALEEPVEVGHAYGELAHDRAGVDRFEPERLTGVGPAQHQLTELDEPALAEPGQVHDPGERIQRLRGADVVGGLLAPDVLLTRLQGEHEAAPALGVERLARDPPGHLAYEALGRGEEPERGAAEVEPVAERLALADAHVDAAVAGRPRPRAADRRRTRASRRSTCPPRPGWPAPRRCRGSSAAARRSAALSSSTAAASASRSVAPAPSSGTSTTSMP